MGGTEVSPARKALVDAVYGDYYDTLVCAGNCANPCATRCPSADDLIDAYVHELAEKIREGVTSPYQDWGGNAYRAAAADAANLIDPEAT